MVFQPGHKRLGGRKKGVSNKHPKTVKESLLEAGAQLGSDGKGKDGLVGFFVSVGLKRPETLGNWIASTLPRPSVNRVDEGGNPLPSTTMTINVIGVPSGTFVDQETYLRSTYGELPGPLLELEAVNDEDDPPDET